MYNTNKCPRHGGNNFVFNAFLYLKPLQRFEKMVRIGGPGAATTARVRAFWIC